MIQITQLKLPVGHQPEELKTKAAKILRVAPDKIETIVIRRQSLDARKKPELFYIYTLDVELKSLKCPKGKTKKEQEKAVIHKVKNVQILLSPREGYCFVKPGIQKLAHPPIVIGTGPAGLFCGLMLAREGYRPLLLERGFDVLKRQEMVTQFWETGILDVRSNVQFGEGGAGTFSDGKLNTLVKDPQRRNQLVLEIFREFGANEEILYQNKPHIGTDVLSRIVKRMREEIIRFGGEVRFGCQVTGLLSEQGRICGVVTEQGENISAEAVVLAIGHSSRDTFAMLQNYGVPMSAKAFAVGLRIQHPQKMINCSQYGKEKIPELGAADYKLTWKSSLGRGVYSFCMCPGGYVVNASSESGKLAINGMSYHDRGGANANSALIVTVTPDDFPDNTPLAGVAFQRRLEELAYQCADGKIPIQLYGDFRKKGLSSALGDVFPQMKGAWEFAALHQILPPVLCEALMEGIESFGQKIPGFNRADAILAGVESRTSSPVRIWRDEQLESKIKGLFPCGEGAGYAGGITSAAMDGVRVAEAIACRYSPF